MPIAPFLAPERDDAFKDGRPARSGETYLTLPGVVVITASTQAATTNVDMYAFIRVATPLVVDQLLAEVTTGAAINFRIGLYRADVAWQPVGAPLADSGDIDATATGVKTYTPGTPVYLRRGRYLTVRNASAAGATLRAYQGDISSGLLDSTLGNAARFTDVRIARTYAAFPTPGTVWTTEGGTTGNAQNHVVFLRVSAP